MTKNISQRWLLIICLLVANVGVAAHLVRASKRRGSSDGVLRAITSLRAIDGRTISVDSHVPSLIEVIDAHNPSAVQEVADTMSQHLRNRFDWIILTSDPDEFRGASSGTHSAYIFKIGTVPAKELIHQNMAGDLWSLYDGKGRLWSTGTFSHGGLPGELAALVDKAPRFSSAVLHAHVSDLDKTGAFVALHEAAARALSHQAVALFVSHVSTGCAIEEVLDKLTQSADNNRNTPDFIAVPPTWDTDEIDALRINMKLSHRIKIIRVNDTVNSGWLEMMHRFGEFDAADFIVVFSPDGIVKVTNERNEIPGILQIPDAK